MSIGRILPRLFSPSSCLVGISKAWENTSDLYPQSLIISCCYIPNLPEQSTRRSYFLLSIRRFQPSDFERITAIEREAFGEYNPLLFMSAYEAFPDGFLVAEQDGYIVGFVVTVFISLFDVKILSIAVDRRYQNRGFASMLLAALFEILRSRGIPRLLLEVRLSNVRAQKLYLSLGFDPVKIIYAYYQDGENAYLMEKLLV